MNVNCKITITAIIGLVTIECFALYKGINGSLYTIVVAAIAGLAGFTLKKIIK